MERRAKTIETHLKRIKIPKGLLEESVKIGLECADKVTKLLKVSAAVGLLSASRKRGIPYSVSDVAEMMGIDRKKIFHAFSKMHIGDAITPIETLKTNYLEKFLKEYSGDNSLREKAFELLKLADGETPRAAALSAYNKALDECGYNYEFNTFPMKRKKSYDKLLAQQQELLNAKQPNIIVSKQYSVRLLSLISGMQPPENPSLPSLSLLDLEKQELSDALGLSLSKYAATY
ncbi:unnamed protein product [Blepharisma stoltei]|uniref:Uncharacterized protein n=1 Tax=Blepharisma stoltei TaxID=1481888 RepID=A0AAU9IVS7_9CILI|nr:unnamed protein product [Blepharisma stoltei]